MPFSGWLARETIVCPHHGILAGDIKEGTTDMCKTLDDSPGNCTGWK